MDGGVEGLDPSVHHFGESGEGVHRNGREACFGQGAVGAAGRDDLDATFHKPAGEGDQVVLVAHGDERAADRYEISHESSGECVTLE